MKDSKNNINSKVNYTETNTVSTETCKLQPDNLQYDRDGLIPAVIQDARTEAVLMVGYMNREALRRTMESGKVWFWSRSRRVYWLKGETSGNFFEVSALYADCDADTLLVKVRLHGQGAACHTGRYSCFFNLLAGFPPPAPLQPYSGAGKSDD
ncbi:MAG: phosphoribosyl-AMP cyclohydrolase [Bacillota bacterium]